MKRLIPSTMLLLLTACGGSGSASSPAVAPPVGGGEWFRPAPLATWQIQLQGTIDTSASTELYDIDLFDSSTALIAQLQGSGAKVICYFSAGSYEEWRSDANQFPAAVLGNDLDGWPGEKWLDIRAESVMTVMEQRLDLAVEKGCDGVDPDNVDGYRNGSGFPLSAQDQLNYNRRLANAAHQRGLAVGLKNDLSQIGQLVDYFDFSVNEQCFAYDECDLLLPFIAANKAVFNVEYDARYVDDIATRQALCSEANNLQFSTLVMPLALDGSFRYSCN